MYNNSPPKTSRLSLFGVTLLIMAMFGITSALQLLSPQAVNAQASQQPRIDLQQAAEEACKSSKEPAACRNGFRRGYAGESVNTSCDNRSDYSKDEKGACKQGHSKGKQHKADMPSADTPAATLNAKTKNLGKGGTCGNSKNPDENVHTNFDFGCLGPDYDIDTHGALGPVEDIVYAIIRFMSIGVGIVVVISIIIAGIQYTSSEGNPEVTQQAKDRVRFTVFGLFVYIFAYTIMQYLVPGGLFK